MYICLCELFVLNSATVKLCCDVLSKLFTGVAASGLLLTFHEELEVGLNHPSEDVRDLCLSQVSNAIWHL